MRLRLFVVTVGYVSLRLRCCYTFVTTVYSVVTLPRTPPHYYAHYYTLPDVVVVRYCCFIRSPRSLDALTYYTLLRYICDVTLHLIPPALLRHTLFYGRSTPLHTFHTGLFTPTVPRGDVAVVVWCDDIRWSFSCPFTRYTGHHPPGDRNRAVRTLDILRSSFLRCSPIRLFRLIFDVPTAHCSVICVVTHTTTIYSDCDLTFT